ncbi:MAG: hypothetical protein RR531_10695 [Longicatena sp.]
MKKINKVFMSALAFTAMASFATSNVFAATDNTGTTDVTYTNTTVIPDPENPDSGTAQWGVSIPKAFNFTDTTKVINSFVSLEKMNGATTLPANLNIDITVASEGNYKMTYFDGAKKVDPVDYNVKFGTSAPNSGTVGTLTTDAAGLASAPIKGRSEMTGTAKQSGTHTDKLTFTISKK